MKTSTASMANELVILRGHDLPGVSWLRIIFATFLFLASLVFIPGVINGQSTASTEPADSPYVVEGESDTMAYAVGRSLRINGTVKNGAIAMGGDVIVQGIVEGDVAAIGGSVIQLEGARINGDVMVVGGTYRPVDKVPSRGAGAQTIMYAGYEQELRSMIRNPKDLLTPRWSAAYFGFRLLAILFWFIVSLALTAAMPGTISRGIARLQLSSLRVAVIGFLGALVISVGVPFSLHYLPSPVSVVVGLMALLLILIAGLFGRVIIYAATGRWLQRKFFRVGKNSEAVALLLGTTFWITLSSLPYVWPFVVAMVLVTSLGLALTARYRVGWRKREES
jgi:hypothetical protein